MHIFSCLPLFPQLTDSHCEYVSTIYYYLHVLFISIFKLVYKIFKQINGTEEDIISKPPVQSGLSIVDPSIDRNLTVIKFTILNTLRNEFVDSELC